MNAWRWFGAGLFVFATVCMFGIVKNSPEARGQGADDKKFSITATPDNPTVKAGESTVVVLSFTRGKEATNDITLTVEAKGVTAKVDPKVSAKDKDTKLTIEAKSDLEAGDYKVTVTAKSAGSPDVTKNIFVDVKKGDVAKKEDKKPEDKKPETPVTGGQKLPFKAFDASSKPFYTEQKTKTTQKMKVMQQDVTQEQTQEFLIKWTPKPEDKDKNWVVEQEIKGVKLKIDIGGNKIDYDSTVKNPKNPMTDFFEQLQKQKLTFTIDPKTYKVVKVDGRDEFIKGLSDINPQMRSLLNAILSDKALKNMAEPAWYAYPESGSFAKDQAWERKSDLDLGPIGKYETKFNFTVKSADAAKATVGITTKLTYTAPAEKQGLPFVIKNAKLTSESGEGKAEFDGAKGRFTETTLKMTLKGDLEIEVGNMTTTVNLTQEQNATSTTKDDAPAEWKLDAK